MSNIAQNSDWLDMYNGDTSQLGSTQFDPSTGALMAAPQQSQNPLAGLSSALGMYFGGQSPNVGVSPGMPGLGVSDINFGGPSSPSIDPNTTITP